MLVTWARRVRYQTYGCTSSHCRKQLALPVCCITYVPPRVHGFVDIGDSRLLTLISYWCSRSRGVKCTTSHCQTAEQSCATKRPTRIVSNNSTPITRTATTPGRGAGTVCCKQACRIFLTITQGTQVRYQLVPKQTSDS